MNKIRWTLVLLVIGIGLHSYLTLHYYPLKFGAVAGESLCNISAILDCDAVSASSYSSIADIPIALFGAFTNLLLFLMLLAQLLGLIENKERNLRYAFWLSGFVALTSLVMAGISLTLVGAYCLFCIILYFISFAVFDLLRRSANSPSLSSLKSDLKDLVGEGKPFLFGLVAIPVLSLVMHKSFVSSYGAENLEVVVRSSVNEWTTNPSYDFQSQPSMALGASRETAKLILTEFADFRCGHCKHAAPSLHAFTNAHASQVRLEFYSFALDGECNSAIPTKNGISCRLAYATLCAEKQNKGWQMHDAIFDNQNTFFSTANVSQTDQKIQEFSQQISVNFTELKACMDLPETKEAISAQALDGVNAKVEGTPSVFANGKKLSRGQLIPVLKATLNKIEK